MNNSMKLIIDKFEYALFIKCESAEVDRNTAWRPCPLKLWRLKLCRLLKSLKSQRKTNLFNKNQNEFPQNNAKNMARHEN